MRPSTKRLLLASVAFAGTWGLGGDSQGGGNEPATVAKTARGGILTTTPRHQFEIFFYPTGVRVFPTSTAGQPVDLARTTGTVTFYHPNSPAPWFSRTLRINPTQTGSLDLAIGLENAPASGAKVTFEVTGLGDSRQLKETFTVPLEFVTQSTSESTALQGNAPPVPRYTYTLGYSGYGYYPEVRPAGNGSPASVNRSYTSPTGPSGGDAGSVGSGHRDWSTGRDSPLAKPWMRSMD